MITGKKGIDLIKSFEGWFPSPYLCPAGKWTIGYGHLIGSGDVFNGPITEEQGEQLLHQDLMEAEGAVGILVKAKLNQNQFDALVSFTFNLGSGNLSASTLLRLLNEGDYQGAADQFPRWVYAAGKKLEGLVRRREAERKLFLEEEGGEN